MPGLSPAMLIGLAISAIVVVVWYYRSKGGMKAKQITALRFRYGGELERVPAESKYGVAHLRDGGYMIRPGSLIHERSGRPWTTPKDDAHSIQLRKRTEALLLREGDPSPMDLSRENYVGETVKNDDVYEIENQAHRLAAVQAVVDGDPGDQMGRRLSLTLLLAVIAAVGAWVTVFAVQVMNGSQV